MAFCTLDIQKCDVSSNMNHEYWCMCAAVGSQGNATEGDFKLNLPHTVEGSKVRDNK